MKNKYLGFFSGFTITWIYFSIDTHIRLNKLKKEIDDYYGGSKTENTTGKNNRDWGKYIQ
jgi:hypothetical protein